MNWARIRFGRALLRVAFAALPADSSEKLLMIRWRSYDREIRSRK